MHLPNSFEFVFEFKMEGKRRRRSFHLVCKSLLIFNRMRRASLKSAGNLNGDFNLSFSIDSKNERKR